MGTIRWYGRWDRVFSEGIPLKWQRVIWDWMKQQRWFLDKHSVRVKLITQQARCFTVGDAQVWQLLVLAGERIYQVALVLVKQAEASSVVVRMEGHETGLVVDAWRWPPLARWSWERLQGRISCPDVFVEAGASNSQVRFGEQAVLKVQRVITPGIHPEVEMGELLLQRKASMTVPLLALLREGEHTLGLLFAFQAGARDGWSWFLEQGRTPASFKALEKLGQRTKELHQLLGQPSEDIAFAPVEMTDKDWLVRQQFVTERLSRIMTLLKQHRPTDLRTATLLQKFLRQPPVVEKVCDVPMMKKHRIHGDFHLGQVLRTADDWKIIDFEGEPLRPLEERRAKDLPLRDVAGMLRSFHYGLAMQGCKDTGILQAVRHAFLQGYDIGDSKLLKLLELEKALYEIEYEVRSRPDWLWIPLEAVTLQSS
jgi:predicted trehalose synthase